MKHIAIIACLILITSCAGTGVTATASYGPFTVQYHGGKEPIEPVLPETPPANGSLLSGWLSSWLK